MKEMMNKLKRYRLSIVFLILAFFSIVFYVLGNIFLGLFRLQLRPWLLTVMLVLFNIGKYGFIASVTYFLVKCFRKKFEDQDKKLVILKKTAFVILFALLLIGIAIMSFWDLFILAFSYKPEHIVTRKGIKCVACVTSFLDMHVDCYEYHGPFFMGEKSVSSEWYGSGSGDPFERGIAPYESEDVNVNIMP